MVFEISEKESGWSLRKWSRYFLPAISYPSLATLARKKKIFVNKKPVKLNDNLKNGDKIEILDSLFQPTQQKTIKKPTNLQKMIIFENEDFFVIEKPHGICAQGEENSIAELSNGYIVHRLDKTTSGLMIVAKTKISADFFSNLFRNGLMVKEYQAICVKKNIDFEKNDTKNSQKNFPEHFSERFPEQKRQIILEKTGIWIDKIDNQEASTKFEILGQNGRKILLKLTPKTGRKHQIRIHCAQNGLPILGDLKYGNFQNNRINLHCKKLSFKDCKGKIQTFESKFDLKF